MLKLACSFIFDSIFCALKLINYGCCLINLFSEFGHHVQVARILLFLCFCKWVISIFLFDLIIFLGRLRLGNNLRKLRASCWCLKARIFCSLQIDWIFWEWQNIPPVLFDVVKFWLVQWISILCMWRIFRFHWSSFRLWHLRLMNSSLTTIYLVFSIWVEDFPSLIFLELFGLIIHVLYRPP